MARLTASYATQTDPFVITVDTRLPRMPKTARVSTLEGVPETGPPRVRIPLNAQNRLPRTTTSGRVRVETAGIDGL